MKKEQFIFGGIEALFIVFLFVLVWFLSLWADNVQRLENQEKAYKETVQFYRGLEREGWKINFRK